MYYLLQDQYIDEEKQMIWGGDLVFEDGESIDFDLGKRVEENISKLQFIIDWDPEVSQEGFLTDYNPQDGINGLVISEKVVQVLLSIGIENIQVFDLEVIDEKNNKIYPDYKIINIIGTCDCIDEENSDITYYTSDSSIMMIDELAVLESKIPKDLLIFRLEKFKPLIVVHESVKNAIEKAELTGFVFEETV